MWKYQPQVPNMVGWQYTSKGRVDGIVGNVDMNVWYKELEAVQGTTEAYSKPLHRTDKTVEENSSLHER